MQLNRSEQYQNQSNLDNFVIRTYQYNISRQSDYFYFDSFEDWNVVISGVTNLNVNNGLEVIAGITNSEVGIQSIQLYNPLSVLSPKTTRPNFLSANNTGGAKKVRKNYRNLQRTKFVVKSGAVGGSTITLRYYTDDTYTKYFNVAIALPQPNTYYHVKFNKFFAGSYGSVGTPLTLKGKTINTAQAVVSFVGTPTGNFIDTIGYSTTTFGGDVTPIYLQEASNDYQFTGQSINIPICCLKETTREIERTYQDIKCTPTDISGKVFSEGKIDIDFTTSKRMELLLALSYTSELYEESLRITGSKSTLEIIDFKTTLSGNVSSANLAMLSLSDQFGCVPLQRDYVNNTSATLDPNFFFLNEANGEVTFSNQMPATEVEAYPYVEQLVRSMDLYTRLNPIRAVLEMQQKSINGIQTDGGLYLIDLGVGVPANDDEGNTFQFTNSVVLDGYRKALQFTY